MKDKHSDVEDGYLYVVNFHFLLWLFCSFKNKLWNPIVAFIIKSVFKTVNSLVLSLGIGFHVSGACRGSWGSLPRRGGQERGKLPDKDRERDISHAHEEGWGERWIRQVSTASALLIGGMSALGAPQPSLFCALEGRGRGYSVWASKGWFGRGKMYDTVARVCSNKFKLIQNYSDIPAGLYKSEEWCRVNNRSSENLLTKGRWNTWVSRLVVAKGLLKECLGPICVLGSH